MDDTQLLDCTQAIPCDLDDDEEEKAPELVAWLEVSGNRHEVFSGKNIIGRDSDKCEVVIPSKVLSKQHAVVEVRSGTHTLADLDSCNRTWLGEMVLRPHVQYALQGGEKIRFGNVAATYTIRHEVCDDSGSETGSETMLPMMAEEEERSSSPLLSPSLDLEAPQNDHGVVENGLEMPGQNNDTPEANRLVSLISPGTSLRVSDSFVQASDADSSVISATQSPAGRTFTPLFPEGTHKSQEDYNSDASTDVEDNDAVDNLSTAPQHGTPTNTGCHNTVPETPSQHCPESKILKDPCHSPLSNTSVQETPTGPFLTPNREDTAHPSQKIYKCETPSFSPSATEVETPACTQRDNLARKSDDSEDFFKKPLSVSTLKPHKISTDLSQMSPLVSKPREAIPAHLFSTGNKHPADLDAPTQILTSDVPSDESLGAPTQVFTSDIDLDAPTQVFTHDTSVDLDAPTQVFASNIDLDAPTQVFTSEVSSDIDFDAPTQVFTNEVTNDVNLDTPTNVFTHGTCVNMNAPTQVFTRDAVCDDPDAATQVFTSVAVCDVDPDTPTQVFTSNAVCDVDPNAPTQVFNNDETNDVDPDALTQVFDSNSTNDVDPDAPTQAFNNDATNNVDTDALTQVFDSNSTNDVDPDAPTQAFNSDATNDVDPDVPTQVFNNDATNDVDPDAPTQVFDNNSANDVDPDAPTQVFNSNATNDDADAPTQVLNNNSSYVDTDAPTQVFNNNSANDIEPDALTQVFNSNTSNNDDTDAPTQVFNNNSANGIDPNTPTQVFNSNATSNDGTDAPAEVFFGKTSPNVEDKLDSLTYPLPSLNASNKADSSNTNPPGSPNILSDTNNTDIPTQLYSNICASTPRLTNSIAEVWGQLESTVHQSSCPALPGLDKRSNHENYAASYTSKSLFNDQDETHSVHGTEKQSGISEDTGSSHKPKGETYQEDENFELKEDMTAEAVMSNSETYGKAASSPPPQCQYHDDKGHLDTHLKALSKKNEREPACLNESESEENICNKSIELFDLPSSAEFLEQVTSTQHVFSQGHKEDSKDIHALTPHKEKVEDVGIVVRKQQSKRFSSQGRKESCEDILAATPHKGRAKQHGQDKFEENINLDRLPAEENEAFRKDLKAVAYPTRRVSTRLCSQNTRSQNRTGRAISCPTAAESASASSLIQTSTSSSLASASKSTSVSLSLTTTPYASPVASASFSTNTLQSIAPLPNTRSQKRKGEIVSGTDSHTISVTDSSVTSKPTRRYGKMSMYEGKVDLATVNPTTIKSRNTEVTTMGSITTTISTDAVIPITSFVSATFTTTSVAAAITSSSTQNKKTRQKTLPERVTFHSKVKVKSAETVLVIDDSTLPQPFNSADGDTKSSPVTTRKKRGRPSVKPHVTKIKVEVPDDEPAQITTLATVKREKEEIDVHACEQIPIKVEPEENFFREENRHPRRQRCKPERFTPERDCSVSSRNVRSKKSLLSLEPNSRVLRDNTSGAGKSIRGRTLGDVPEQQHRSYRVKGRVNEEPDVSEEGTAKLLAQHSFAPPETDSPPKKNTKSRASSSRSGKAASKAAKKIKIEVTSEEESNDDTCSVPESSSSQSQVKEVRKPCSKRSNLSTSSRQRTKRSISDPSDAGSLTSNSSFSSRGTRSNKDVELWSPSKRQRQASCKPRVLFTGYHDPADHKIVMDLGGRVVETPLDCTVLVTTKLKRTCKLLSAIGRGCVIVSPNWLTMSKAAGNFVDPWLFLLKDREAEEKYGFCLEATIKSASTFLLFEGLSLHATPSVQPPPCQMRDIVECAGGDYLHSAPKKYAPQIRIISCGQDKRMWPAFKSLGIPILGEEFILTGLLRHELLLDEFVLG